MTGAEMAPRPADAALRQRPRMPGSQWSMVGCLLKRLEMQPVLVHSLVLQSGMWRVMRRRYAVITRLHAGRYKGPSGDVYDDRCSWPVESGTW
jgi:hypothetical protein